MGIKSLTKEKADKIKIGVAIKEEDLDNFSDEQLAQLYELYSEAKKPIDLKKDPHLASWQKERRTWIECYFVVV